MADSVAAGDRRADWSDNDLLDNIGQASFDFFMAEANRENGMIRDRNRPDSPASIASVGMGLSALPLGVERGVLKRDAAAAHALKTLAFLWQAPQSTQADASGYKGFFYHFLDYQTGRRVWNCELSTIDTALLMAGVLSTASAFDRDDPVENEIRRLADLLYHRVDWAWALGRGPTLRLGWKPRSGFLRHRWSGFDESLILYILALGSPTHPIPPEAYAARNASYRWDTVGGQEHFVAGPLFIHQMSHIWIDFRGIQDAAMRERGIDYFENSRRATYAQRHYAIDNPHGFDGYHENSWGITASDGPGPCRRRIQGKWRRFYGYVARGAPEGPDDGTISPWATAASLPFAPEIVLPAVRHFHRVGLRQDKPYGFTSSFNPTFGASEDRDRGWVAPDHISVNQGPIALMVANHRNEFLWKLMRSCPYIVTGLRKAGFNGGWLGNAQPTGEIGGVKTTSAASVCSAG